MTGMQSEVESHIAAVTTLYAPLMKGNASRLQGGEKLWAQFESAANFCDVTKPASVSALIERVNELAVAQLILNDPVLEGELQYEPDIIPDGRRIDFVIVGTSENTYIEVKTVNPRADDSDASWQRYVGRRENHPENVNYIVDKKWRGAEVYGNSFSARSHFLEYTLKFEARLVAAKAVRPGLGRLIFCGTGFAWHLSELEDFVDFYLTGRHRSDDKFGPMEGHDLQTKQIELQRNISEFAFVKRGM